MELLSEFYYQFPRELDAKLGRHLSDDQIERFSKGGPQDQEAPGGHTCAEEELARKPCVLEKMESLRQLENRPKGEKDRGSHEKEKGGRCRACSEQAEQDQVAETRSACESLTID